MRIAVIGSGIAGLTVSQLLIEAGHQVTVFERQVSAGIDAHSLNIELEGKSVRADVPSRMFNKQLWPTLCRFYDRIGVASTTVDLTQSFSQLGGRSYLNLDNANRPSNSPIQLLKARTRNLLQEAVRLRDNGKQDLQNGIDAQLTFADYLKQNEYSSAFVNEFLYPTLSSTVFTCGYAGLDAYPATVLLDTLSRLNEAAELQRAKGGSQFVVSKLLQAIEDARFGHTVLSVQGETDDQGGVKVEVRYASQNESGKELFDHVVVATQANTAGKLLPNLSDSERDTLDSFSYESIPIFVHTDESLMPSERKGWATFNMVTRTDTNSAMCSVWLNRFHNDWGLTTPVFQSINSIAEPAPELTLGSCVMQRPVVDGKSLAAVKQIGRWHEQPGRRIWFCGSYASEGTPLLESGVVSAESVAQRIAQLTIVD